MNVVNIIMKIKLNFRFFTDVVSFYLYIKYVLLIEIFVFLFGIINCGKFLFIKTIKI